MTNQLRLRIEKFIIDYENQLTHIDNIEPKIMGVLLENAVVLLGDTIDENSCKDID